MIICGVYPRVSEDIVTTDTCRRATLGNESTVRCIPTHTHLGKRRGGCDEELHCEPSRHVIRAAASTCFRVGRGTAKYAARFCNKGNIDEPLYQPGPLRDTVSDDILQQHRVRPFVCFCDISPTSCLRRESMYWRRCGKAKWTAVGGRC